MREITISTLFGDIAFKRRYYKDTETKSYVYPLDEVLGIDGWISPCLAEVAAVETDGCFLHMEKQGRGNQELTTIVVINGDRALFGKGRGRVFSQGNVPSRQIYVKRDLKQFLRGTEGLKECLNAFDASDSKVLVESLFTAIPKIKDKGRREKERQGF